MINGIKIVILISFCFLFSCIKNDNVFKEDMNFESMETNKLMETTNQFSLINIDYLKWKNEHLKLIKNVHYPDEPQQFIFQTLKKMETFLELEKYADDLLNYAFDIFTDELLCKNDKMIVAYVLLSIDFDKFKYLLRDIAQNYLNGKIKGYIANFLFFPGHPGFGVRNYDDPVIVDALETYIKNENVDIETRISIITNRLKREVTENEKW